MLYMDSCDRGLDSVVTLKSSGSCLIIMGMGMRNIALKLMFQNDLSW